MRDDDDACGAVLVCCFVCFVGWLAGWLVRTDERRARQILRRAAVLLIGGVGATSYYMSLY